jgi:hypothetical protein
MGRSALLVLLVAAAAPARADTVDATVSTLIAGRQDPRDGRVYTVVPIYETLTLTVGDVQLRHLDDFRIVVSGWGELALGDPRDGLANGDLDVGYVEGKLFDRRLSLRVGRQFVFGGAARARQIDGGSLTVRIWKGLGINVYGGAPVTPRFATYQGDAIAGTRLFWRQSFNTELGLSFVHVLERGRVAREDLGADARWQAHRTLALTGYALLSLTELRLAEGDVAATWQPIPMLEVRADYRRTAPDLFLPRSSILSVFTQESHDEAGGSFYLRPVSRVRITGDYHAIVDNAGTGNRAGLKLNVYVGQGFQTSLGAEGRVLTLPGNGYTQARLFVIHRLLPTLAFTLDADTYILEQALNGQTVSFTGAATVGWDFRPGWRVVGTAIGDVTPFVERRFEGMIKIVYNQTFHVREAHK